jgi:hypothetical protein
MHDDFEIPEHRKPVATPVVLSLGNTMARDIAAEMERVIGRVEDWLDAHGGDCDCVFCADMAGGVCQEEFEAARWALSRVVAGVSSYTVNPVNYRTVEPARRELVAR